MNMSGKCTPLRGPQDITNFPSLGKEKRLMGPRNHEIFFPDMCIEHVWEITPTGPDFCSFFFRAPKVAGKKK